MIELSKNQKKIARQLIDLGLQRECKSFMEKIATFTGDRNWETDNPHEIYLKLYKKIVSFDKHISRRYDDLTGSNYLLAVLGLFNNDVLTTEDIALFDDELKNLLLNLSQTLK